MQQNATCGNVFPWPTMAEGFQSPIIAYWKMCKRCWLFMCRDTCYEMKHLSDKKKNNRVTFFGDPPLRDRNSKMSGGDEMHQCTPSEKKKVRLMSTVPLPNWRQWNKVRMYILVKVCCGPIFPLPSYLFWWHVHY